MHGTFRSHVESGAETTVRFDARAPTAQRRTGYRRVKAMLLLAGCCLVAVPEQVRMTGASGQGPDRAGPVPLPRVATVATEADEPILSSFSSATRRSPSAVPELESKSAPEQSSAAVAELSAMSAVPVIDDSRLAPGELKMVLPPLASDERLTKPQPAAQPIPLIAASSIAAIEVTIPLPPSTLPQPPASSAAGLAAAPERLRPVDIEQISESEVRSLRMAQLHESGLAAGGPPTLAARIDAMQVTLPPPPRLRDAERAALLAEAPSQMLVRVGDSALGDVAFRTTGALTIDVQLSGLLDLLADRFDSSEFERLRDSAAADAFVGFDQLRAIGLNLRYDPVYDELRITG